jgi:hypothetical protein
MIGICTVRTLNGILYNTYLSAISVTDEVEKEDHITHIASEFVHIKIDKLKKDGFPIHFVNTKMDILDYEHCTRVYDKILEPFGRGLLDYLKDFTSTEKLEGMTDIIYAFKRLLILCYLTSINVIEIKLLDISKLYNNLTEFLSDAEAQLTVRGESLADHIDPSLPYNIFESKHDSFVYTIQQVDVWVFGDVYSDYIFKQKSKVPQIVPILPSTVTGILIDDNDFVIADTRSEAPPNLLVAHVDKFSSLTEEELTHLIGPAQFGATAAEHVSLGFTEGECSGGAGGEAAPKRMAP